MAWPRHKSAASCALGHPEKIVSFAASRIPRPLLGSEAYVAAESSPLPSLSPASKHLANALYAAGKVPGTAGQMINKPVAVS